MHFTSTGIASVLGMPARTVQYWIDRGFVHPFIDVPGKGNHRVFALFPDILVLALGQGLRANGFTLEMAGKAMGYVGSLALVDFERALAEGRDRLVMLGPEPVERLLSLKELADSRALPAAANAGAPIIAIDVGRLYRHLLEQVKEPVTV